MVACMDGLSKRVDKELVQAGVDAEAAFSAMEYLRDENAFAPGCKGMTPYLMSRDAFRQDWNAAVGADSPTAMSAKKPPE
jgi:hypothetical protein